MSPEEPVAISEPSTGTREGQKRLKIESFTFNPRPLFCLQRGGTIGRKEIWREEMHYATIKYYDIANGEGVRTSLFVSGCRHHCKECFNQVAWDFEYGEEFTKDTEDKIIASLSPSYIRGLSLLGGEPMEKENQEALLDLIKRVKVEAPNKDIWIYSGFTFEELIGEKDSRAYSPISKEILSLCDVLVDGRFILEEKDISLQFRGSRNQRIIMLKPFFEKGEFVLWKDEMKD